MSTNTIPGYFFGIEGQVVGPLGLDAIEKRIADSTVTRTTLAWCAGMDRWRPAGEIAELAQVFGQVLAACSSGGGQPASAVHATGVCPPPLPEESATVSGRSSAGTNSCSAVPQNLSAFESAAYRMVCWLYQPWRGRPSRIRQYVEQNPRRAVPVAAATIGVLGLLLVMAVSAMVPPEAPPGPSARSFPGPMPSGPQLSPGVFQPMIRAQQDISNTIDDVYRYNRDAFDRGHETYKRATYDWYNSSND